MKFHIALAVLVAVAAAAPQHDGKAQVRRYDIDNRGVDGYHSA